MDKKNLLKFILGFNIKQLRKRKGISLKELSKRSELSVSYLNEIEKGKKYPSFNKLFQIAQGFEVEVDQLVSSKLGKSLYPMLRLLTSDIIQYLPLKQFGISIQDVFELMSQSPEQFASFMLTISQITKSYDLTLEDLHKSAIRAYQEVHQNYFPEFEKIAEVVREEIKREYQVDFLGEKELHNYLVKKYQYTIDFELLSQNQETEKIRSIFKQGKNKNLLINNKLDTPQKSFVMAREIGANELNLKGKSITGVSFNKISFEESLNDYNTSYFAGALLIPRDELIEQLKQFFQKKYFDTNFMMEIAQKFNTSIEVLFHRVMQVLPHYFNLDQIFFMRMKLNTKKEKEDFYITKELHLSELHSAHSNNLFEHYCRKWVTIKSLLDLKNSPGVNFISNGQISYMVENDKPYLCFSIARESRRDPSILTGVTIGILISPEFKKLCQFLEDVHLNEVRTGNTCERCSEVNCKERAVEPFIYNKIEKNRRKEKAVNNLLSSLE